MLPYLEEAIETVKALLHNLDEFEESKRKVGVAKLEEEFTGDSPGLPKEGFVKAY